MTTSAALLHHDAGWVPGDFRTLVCRVLRAGLNRLVHDSIIGLVRGRQGDDWQLGLTAVSPIEPKSARSASFPHPPPEGHAR